MFVVVAACISRGAMLCHGFTSKCKQLRYPTERACVHACVHQLVMCAVMHAAVAVEWCLCVAGVLLTWGASTVCLQLQTSKHAVFPAVPAAVWRSSCCSCCCTDAAGVHACVSACMRLVGTQGMRGWKYTSLPSRPNLPLILQRKGRCRSRMAVLLS
jgi:hypothetical protein